MLCVRPNLRSETRGFDQQGRSAVIGRSLAARQSCGRHWGRCRWDDMLRFKNGFNVNENRRAKPEPTRFAQNGALRTSRGTDIVSTEKIVADLVESFKTTGRIVIVGASLAGLRAAEGLRDAGFNGKLTIIGDESHEPYDRPPLSKQVLMGSLPAGDTSSRHAADLTTLVRTKIIIQRENVK